MTLLLNLVGPGGIHQSSDFRLTDVATRRPIDDQFGSKQLEHMTSRWSAWISFTGFAQIGGRKTRDWILDSLKGSLGSADAAMANLAGTAAIELRRVPQKDWFLTIVATVVEPGQATRVFVVSCVDRPGKPPLDQPLDHFEVCELSVDSAQVFIFGCARAVAKADKKFLEKLGRSSADQAEIRRSLARVNARSAKRSGGAVSSGCLVSSTTPDGRNALENFGGAPGVPADVAGSDQILEMIAKAHKGKRPAYKQGRGATAMGAKELTLGPMNISEGSTLVAKYSGDSPVLFVTDSSGSTFKEVPRPAGSKGTDEDAEWAKYEEGSLAGPAHLISFSSTSGSYMFLGPDRSNYGAMEVIGAKGDTTLAKNRAAKITLGTVTIQISDAFRHQAERMRTTWNVPISLTVDGVQPRDWDYAVVMVLDSAGGTVSIQRNSVALRSANYPSPVPCLSESEELVSYRRLAQPL
jgi:hypothetical protein